MIPQASITPVLIITMIAPLCFGAERVSPLGEALLERSQTS